MSVLSRFEERSMVHRRIHFLEAIDFIGLMDLNGSSKMVRSLTSNYNPVLALKFHDYLLGSYVKHGPKKLIRPKGPGSAWRVARFASIL